MASSKLSDFKAQYLKRQGDESLKHGNYKDAWERYSEALQLADTSSQLHRALLSNRSRAYCSAGRPQQALQDADLLLRSAPLWAKAWWRRGKALQGLGRHAEAAAALAQSHHLCPLGSQEQRECRKEALAAVRRMTRTQLAAGLLACMAQHRHPDLAAQLVQQAVQRADGASMDSDHGASATASAPAALPALTASEAAAGQGEQSDPSAVLDALLEVVGQQGVSSALTAEPGSRSGSDMQLVPLGQQLAKGLPSGQQQEAAEELLEAMFEVVKEAAALHMHAKSAAAGRGGSSSGGPQQQQRHVPAAVWDLPGEYAGWLLASSSTAGASSNPGHQAAAGSSDSTACSAGASSAAAAHRCHQLWAELHLRRGGAQQALWHAERALQLLQGCRAKGPQEEEVLFERLLQCWELVGDVHMAAAQACTPPSAAAARPSATVPAGGPAAAAAAGRRHLQAACCAYLQVQELAPGRRGVGGKVQQVSEQLTTSELNQAYLQLSGSSSAGRLPLLLLGFSSPTSQGTQQSAGPPAEQPEDLQVVVAAAEGQAAGMQATCTGSSSHSHSGRADSQACSSTAAPSSEQAPGHEADTSSPQGPQQAGTSDTPTDLAAEPAGLQQVRCQLAWSSETARTTRGLSPAVRTALRRVLASAAGLPATRVSIDCLRRDLKAGCWAAQLVVDCGTDGAAARQLLGVLARPEQISELLDAPGAGVVQVLGPVDPAAVCARVVRLEDMMEHATSLDQRGQQGSGGGTGCAEAVAVGNEKGGSVTSSAATAAAHAEPSSAVTVVAAEPASAAGSGAVVTAEPAASPGSSERRLALPYLGYKLVDGEGRPVERPDKHPFCLSRVVYQAEEASSQVWVQLSDGSCRWRQSAGEVEVQALRVPRGLASGQLVVELQLYSILVAHRVTGEVYLSGELDRGINPADSGWTYSGGSGEAGCVLQLSKLNLELLQRPWQHSESWWPRLLLVHPQVAWDDGDKDYSDLPEPVRRVHQVQQAREEASSQQEALERQELEALLARDEQRKRKRRARLHELRAKGQGPPEAWRG